MTSSVPELLRIPIKDWDQMRKTEAVRGFRLRADRVSKDGNYYLCHRVCFACQRHVPEGEACCTIIYFRNEDKGYKELPCFRNDEKTS